jgi:SAM-dependent methyltransferase
MDHVCPWWLWPILHNPVRRALQDPVLVLAPFIRGGVAVLEVGPGMGYFTLPAARLVGPSGRVTAVDIQERMLEGLAARARKAGLEGRIATRLAGKKGLGVEDLAGKVDFAWSIWVLHEIPDLALLFSQVFAALRPGGWFLVAEPYLHVGNRTFRRTVVRAEEAGFVAFSSPAVPLSRAVLLAKPGSISS